jgi:threonyl-tRNA synthetase
VLYNTLERFVRERQREDFQEVKTPLLYTKELWEQSGHWGKYRENMFLVLDNETGEHDMSLKPMNCPSHYVYYASAKHSYRELPIRYATLDVLHRNELTGRSRDSRACGSSRRTTATSSCARTRSPRR